MFRILPRLLFVLGQFFYPLISDNPDYGIVLYREEGWCPETADQTIRRKHLRLFVKTLTTDSHTDGYVATVETGHWYSVLSVCSVPVAGIAIIAGEFLILKWFGILCLVLGLLPLYLSYSELEIQLREWQGRTQRVTRIGVLPAVSAVVLLWLTVSTPFRILLIGLTCMLIAGYGLRNDVPSGQTEMMRFAMAFVGMLPIFETGALVGIVTTIRSGSDWISVVAVCSVTLYVSYYATNQLGTASQRALQSFIETELKPMTSYRRRVYWLVMAILMMSASMSLLWILAIDISAYFGLLSIQTGILTPSLRRIDTLLLGPPLLTKGVIAAYLLVLCAPLVLFLLMWAICLGTTVHNRHELLREADPVPTTALAFDPEWPIYQLDQNEPIALALPIWTRREAVIVMNRQMIESYEPEELRAIYEHEAYHINHGQVWIPDLLALFAPLCGGTNGCLAFWLPMVAERAADEHAKANIGGHIPIMDALTRYHTASGAQEHDSGIETLNEQVSRTLPSWIRQSNVVRQYLPMYVLLFGGIGVETAHGPVDDRLIALVD